MHKRKITWLRTCVVHNNPAVRTHIEFAIVGARALCLAHRATPRQPWYDLYRIRLLISVSSTTRPQANDWLVIRPITRKQREDIRTMIATGVTGRTRR